MSIGTVDTSGVTAIDGVDVVEAGSNSTIDSQMFLELLCTQLQYQDMYNTMDTNEMVAQEAQLSQLEAMTGLSDNMTDFMESQKTLMTNLTSVLNNSQTLSILGDTVEYTTDEITVSDGVASDMYYNLSTDAYVGYTVKNSAGTTVASQDPVLVQKGDGNKLDIDASELKDGTYAVEFDVSDTTGTELEGAGYGKQKVTSINFSTGTPQVKLANGQTVGLNEIISVGTGQESET